MARRKGSNHVTQTCSLCLSHLGCVCQALLSRFTLWHLEQQYNLPVQAQQETAGVFSPVLEKSWINPGFHAAQSWTTLNQSRGLETSHSPPLEGWGLP